VLGVVVDVGFVGGSQDARLACGGELAGNSSRPPDAGQGDLGRVGDVNYSV
jgi:hypothetical protein